MLASIDLWQRNALQPTQVVAQSGLAAVPVSPHGSIEFWIIALHRTLVVYLA